MLVNDAAAAHYPVDKTRRDLVEEFRTSHRGLDGEQNARVRADLVYFRTANGGGVLSTGSIAWVTALCHNGYDNNVSRLTVNAVKRFLDPEPLP